MTNNDILKFSEENQTKTPIGITTHAHVNNLSRQFFFLSYLSIYSTIKTTIKTDDLK